MINAFKCPICGKQLVHSDNTGIVKVLRTEIESLKEEIEAN